ncbi:MAG: hypothetical protein AAF363_07960 [Bacteroidota bacterium]
MKPNPKYIQVLFIALFSVSFSAYSQEGRWKLVYEHNESGEVISGSKSDLIEAVRSGKDVKLGWKMGGAGQFVEHYAEVQFLTIMEGEVYGQISPILSQEPSFAKKTVGFREGLKWSLIASTTGVNSTLFYNITDGTALDDGKYRWGNKWYVKD